MLIANETHPSQKLANDEGILKPRCLRRINEKFNAKMKYIININLKLCIYKWIS